MFVAAKQDFKVNGLDVKKGTLFWVEEEEGVIVNGGFFCSVGSPNYYHYFEEIA